MKKMRECTRGRKILTVVASMLLVLGLVLLPEQFAIVGNAQSQGKVIASSANIRKSADPNSEVVGSATKDASVTINNQVTASDNTVWYQVFIDANTLGYIRSDLVQITDGTTPPQGSNDSNTSDNTSNNTTQTTPAVEDPLVDVTAVEPTGAKVKGGDSIRVRANASTNSKIVTQAERGLALTVTGKADGRDGKLWYQVNFISNGQEVTGFIRSDYVELSAELTPPVETAPPVEETPAEPEAPAEPEVPKDWDTQNDSGVWYLINNIKAKRYNIEDIFANFATLEEQHAAALSKTKSQTIVIVILVILIVGMAGALAYLFFKLKDMEDSAYFAEVEKETVRRRTADRPTAGGQKVMHTVGAKPAGQRPTGTRPAGTRPATGSRPTAQRPAGQRPAGARPNGAPVQRPAGARPAGARPNGAPVQGQGSARPTGAPMPNGEGQVRRPAPAPKAPQENNPQNPGWKSKNFMTDDDEFEFEFLNWDGEDQ